MKKAKIDGYLIAGRDCVRVKWDDTKEPYTYWVNFIESESGEQHGDR